MDTLLMHECEAVEAHELDDALGVLIQVCDAILLRHLNDLIDVEPRCPSLLQGLEGDGLVCAWLQLGLLFLRATPSCHCPAGC